MKVLNLDKFGAAEVKQLVIGGKTHVVDEMTVKNFIVTTKAAESMSDTAPVSVQVEATIEMILRSVPTLKKEDLDGLNLVRLQGIVSFIKGEDFDGIETVEKAEGVEGQPGK